MIKSFFPFLALFVAILASSCSSVNKLAVDSSSSLFLEFSDAIKEQDNVELVKEALGSNLLSMESLLRVSEGNKNLLAALTKTYVTYASLINETEMMEEAFVNLKAEKAKKQAIINYSKAINYGLKYLTQYEVTYENLTNKLNESQGIVLLLDQKLSDKKINHEVVFFTAQALMALSVLKKDETTFSSQEALGKAMLNWSCLKNASIEYGACQIFHGLDSKYAKEVFSQAIENHPHNWFIRTIYIQSYLIPQKDEEGFKAQMNQMALLADEFSDEQVFSSIARKKPEWMMESRLRLYQAIAIKRYEILKQYKAQIF